jgi:hypothetical protein
LDAFCQDYFWPFLGGKGCCPLKSNAAVNLSDYMKESKTLNVNVLAEDVDEMNNEIRWHF